MKKYILTIDEGTTSLRVILYNTKKHKIVKLSRAFLPLITPQDQWVEQDADLIYKQAYECLGKICKHIDLDKVYGLGITNQRETIVAWNKTTGEPLANAISWKCRRTAKYCKELAKSKYAKIIREKTGLVINSYFSASKMRWLLDNNKQVVKAAKENNLCFGTIESYLVYRLTFGKSFVTDVTNASRTMLFNIKTLKWDDQLLKIFGINKKFLPKVVDNDAEVGFVKLYGKSIPIAGLIGDQQSSLLGQGCINKGEIKNTYGTGCFMLANIGNEPQLSRHGLITTIASKLNNKISYALEGSIFNGGSIMNQMIKEGIAKNHRQLVKIAIKEQENKVVLIPAFNGLGAPFWKMNVKAKYYGRTFATRKSEIAKAGFEALIFRTWDIFDAMQKDLAYDFTTLCVDGGQSQNKYLMTRQADILQIPLQIGNLESTCMGAVVCTALATKVIRYPEEYKQILKPLKIIKPVKSLNDIQKDILRWSKAMERFLKGE